MKERIKYKKGFTLAEVLIVVAIVSVLVAISIPIFTSRLEKSREAVDLANMRNAYAAAIMEYISAPADTYYFTGSGVSVNKTDAIKSNLARSRVIQLDNGMLSSGL